MLDATEAFDRDEYLKLYDSLCRDFLPPVVVTLFLNTYISYSTQVSWKGIFPNCFNVQNGVKQGGILSSVLFCIYFDGLLRRLGDAAIGCFMGNFFAGVLV
jgi:hypothetical protein